MEAVFVSSIDVTAWFDEFTVTRGRTKFVCTSQDVTDTFKALDKNTTLVAMQNPQLLDSLKDSLTAWVQAKAEIDAAKTDSAKTETAKISNIPSYRFAVWNTEQFSRDRVLESFVLHIQKVRDAFPPSISLEMWDFSAWNAAQFARACPHIPTRVVPSASIEDIETLRRGIKSTPKEFDFAFVGTTSPRRAAALERVCASGKTVVNATSCWGATRDALIMSAKALLNIHFDDTYRVFESVRCGRWLAAGMPVVTEPCVNDEEAIALGATISTL